MPTRFRQTAALTLMSLASAVASAGCVADGKSRPPPERVTYVQKEEATPNFYYAKPPAATVAAADFDALWEQLYRATRDAGFYPDREDHRQGLFTSRPLVSSQWFEPWRGDTGSIYARLQSSLASLRRTVRWDVAKNPDGTFAATPRVLVERYSLLEHRVTSAAQYAEIFALTREEQRNQQLRTLDPASFVNEIAPPAYWYAVGRDEDLERSLAATVRGRVKS